MLMRVPKALRGWGSPIFWNMLTVKPDSVGQGTWVAAVQDTALYCGYFWNSTTADADNFTLEFYCAPGTYTLRFNYQRQTTAGVIDVDIDGTEEATQDMYGSANYIQVHETTGIDIGAGYHTMKFRLDGKNASGSDFRAYLTGIVLVRTA